MDPPIIDWHLPFNDGLIRQPMARPDKQGVEISGERGCNVIGPTCRPEGASQETSSFERWCCVAPPSLVLVLGHAMKPRMTRSYLLRSLLVCPVFHIATLTLQWPNTFEGAAMGTVAIYVREGTTTFSEMCSTSKRSTSFYI